MTQNRNIRTLIREVFLEVFSERPTNIKSDNFVGIHCSSKLFNDDYDGRIIDEYFGSFTRILEIIQNDYPEAKKYLKQIETLDDGLDLSGEDESVDLVFEIESFFVDNNIEWIYVATEALTKYGDNCYGVYFSNLDDVYKMDDELVDNASIYIYNSNRIKPILKKIN
jgi:hypothetical protein